MRQNSLTLELLEFGAWFFWPLCRMTQRPDLEETVCHV